jgi:hypothetical protein
LKEQLFLTSGVKTSGRFFSNFVAFSENLTLPVWFFYNIKNRISGELPYGYKTLVRKCDFSKICNSTQSE